MLRSSIGVGHMNKTRRERTETTLHKTAHDRFEGKSGKMVAHSGIMLEVS